MTDLSPPESKPFYESRTFWAALATAAAPWVPGAGAIVAAHPEILTSALGIVFLLLRTVTKGAVTIS